MPSGLLITFKNNHRSIAAKVHFRTGYWSDQQTGLAIGTSSETQGEYPTRFMSVRSLAFDRPIIVLCHVRGQRGRQSITPDRSRTTGKESERNFADILSRDMQTASLHQSHLLLLALLDDSSALVVRALAFALAIVDLGVCELSLSSCSILYFLFRKPSVHVS